MTRLFTGRRMVAWVALMAAVFALVTAGCTEDGQGGSVVSSIVQDRPEATTPPVTEAPPETETPAPEPPADGGEEDDSLAWLLAIALIVLVAVLIGGAIGGRSRKREHPRQDLQGAQRNSDVNNALATASWLHDSASLDLLSASSGQLSEQWQNVRPRAADLQTQAAALALGSNSPELDAAASALSQAAGAFAGAMDAYVSIETKEGVSGELAAEAKATVMTRRQELQHAIGRVLAAR